MTRAMPHTGSLSALLPLKVRGRHYGDNLARLDLLFGSMQHFAPGLVDEWLVVIRADEADHIGAHLAHWPELPLRVILEEEHFPAFSRYTRPWQMRPWQRQQIIKLNAPALTSSAFVLMLDPDVLARAPITRDLLLPGGRAVLEPEPRRVHPRWWRASADVLELDPGLERPGMNVTPAVLSTSVLRALHRRLEALDDKPWMELLLKSYCDWTEYSLYLLEAERLGLERYHVWADDPAAPVHLHIDPALSIWDPAEASKTQVERLFTALDPGVFAVVQSSSGLRAADVAAAVARHLPLRSIAVRPLPEQGRRSKLRERLRTASRLVAQRVYRVRRAVRRIARRPRPTGELVALVPAGDEALRPLHPVDGLDDDRAEAHAKRPVSMSEDSARPARGPDHEHMAANAEASSGRPEHDPSRGSGRPP